jgi:hypothetical protein
VVTLKSLSAHSQVGKRKVNNGNKSLLSPRTKFESVVFVPETPDSKLHRRLQKVEK